MSPVTSLLVLLACSLNTPPRMFRLHVARNRICIANFCVATAMFYERIRKKIYVEMILKKPSLNIAIRSKILPDFSYTVSDSLQTVPDRTAMEHSRDPARFHLSDHF